MKKRKEKKLFFLFCCPPAKNRNLSRSKKKIDQYLSTHNLSCLVFESSNTFLTYTWLRQTGQQHASTFFEDKHPGLR